MSDNLDRRDNTSGAPVAQEPAQSPAVRWIAIIFSLLLIGLAMVAIRELIYYYQEPAGWQSWLEPLPDLVTGMENPAIITAGIISAIVGLLLIIASFKPRKKRYLKVAAAASASVWVRPVDVARLATATAKRVPGVLASSSAAKKDSVTVSVDVLRRDDQIDSYVSETIAERLQKIFGSDFGVDVELRATGGTQRQEEATEVGDFPEPDPANAPAEPAGETGDSHPAVLGDAGDSEKKG